MTRICQICGKNKNVAVKRVKLRGKYNPTQKKVQLPNLQKTTLPDGRKVLACTKCIKIITRFGKIPPQKGGLAERIRRES